MHEREGDGRLEVELETPVQAGARGGGAMLQPGAEGAADVATRQPGADARAGVAMVRELVAEAHAAVVLPAAPLALVAGDAAASVIHVRPLAVEGEPANHLRSTHGSIPGLYSVSHPCE